MDEWTQSLVTGAGTGLALALTIYIATWIYRVSTSVFHHVVVGGGSVMQE